MNIITVSREFGSGGRELGRRLAETLGYDYYDGQIIASIAKKCGLDEKYVESALEERGWQTVPMTVHNTFASPMILQSPQVGLLLEQKQVIDEIGKAGRSCVIVGRNADLLLETYRPFNIFVCADMETKVRRCIERAKEARTPRPKRSKSESAVSTKTAPAPGKSCPALSGAAGTPTI